MKAPLSANDKAQLIQDVSDDILGYGPIDPYLRDPEVTEVMVNGFDSVWLEKNGRLTKADAHFADEAHLRRTIDKIVSRIGRRVDESSPMVDARLPDGSRVNAIIPPLSLDGSALTIRKFSADPLTVQDLINFGSLTPQTADFLDACIRGRLNVIVSGGTGAGKTTTLNVLSSFIPTDERIVTIEDAAELQLKQEHVVRLESRPSNIEGKGEVSIRDLVRNSLRMRPDRIVVGEVRDASALDMLQAMNTGHDGSICTVHSNGPRDTLSRMETLVLMAGMDLPVRAIREQVAERESTVADAKHQPPHEVPPFPDRDRERSAPRSRRWRSRRPRADGGCRAACRSAGSPCGWPRCRCPSCPPAPFPISPLPPITTIFMLDLLAYRPESGRQSNSASTSAPRCGATRCQRPSRCTSSPGWSSCSRTVSAPASVCSPTPRGCEVGLPASRRGDAG